VANEELAGEIRELYESRRLAEQVADEFQAGATAYRELLEDLSKAADAAIREKDGGLLHKITIRLRDFSANPASLLTPEEQLKLRESVRRELLGAENRKADRISLAHRICGKYAFVPTSSDVFAAKKPEEIELEDRPR
jgi:hypothetical protein